MLVFLILTALVLIAATTALVLLQDAGDRDPQPGRVIPGYLDDEAGA